MHSETMEGTTVAITGGTGPFGSTMDTSNRVVRFISSTADRYHQWAGIRTPSHDH